MKDNLLQKKAGFITAIQKWQMSKSNKVKETNQKQQSKCKCKCFDN